ncbi:MAG: PAS domain-containing sensor histidine kinase [Bacteroidota bacterium]
MSDEHKNNEGVSYETITKDALQVLIESEQRMKAMVDSAMDAVIGMDDQGVIREWNAQAKEMFGFSSSEAIGHKLSELIIPERFRALHDKGMAHFLRTGEGPVLNSRIEVPGLHKSGQEFPIELSIVAIKLKKGHFFSAFLRDITIRKKAEEDFQEALRKQTELSEMKTKFITMMSHEFRTPLTTIQTNIDLLEYTFAGDEQVKYAAKSDKYFTRIGSEIQRLVHLMEDVMLIGKIESGKVDCTPKLIDFQILLEDITEELGSHFEQGKATLIVSGTSRQSYLDPKSYRHICSNLLSNAYKYSVNEKPPQITLAYDEDAFKLSITDYGIGIPESEQDEIFTSFFRASNVGNIQGTGLGLSIVKEYVTMHGGEIEVQGTEGVGTTFIIKQPDTTFNPIFKVEQEFQKGLQ